MIHREKRQKNSFTSVKFLAPPFTESTWEVLCEKYVNCRRLPKFSNVKHQLKQPAEGLKCRWRGEEIVIKLFRARSQLFSLLYFNKFCLCFHRDTQNVWIRFLSLHQ